ncbi:MAG TPA: hypothetical protein PK648_12885, partial [Verrucomicrobiales bacterium]|nr:hypothetical protein [Verrucomicrobiales bacterium]
MASHQLAAVHREAVVVVGLVDLLRERLHHFQTEDETEQRRAEHGRRGAADGGGLQHADGSRDRHETYEARDREAQQAVPSAPPDRGGQALALRGS